MNLPAGFPLLSLIIFVPLVGAVVVALLPRASSARVGQVAFAFAALDFLLSLLVVAGFNPMSPALQFVEQSEWIRQFGVQYFLGLDGISLWLIPLTSLLSMLAILFSWGSISTRIKEYYALMLLLSTAMLGVFSAMDLFLFFVFWEASLIPMYFLIGMWGGRNRIYATIKFVLYTMAGSALMLVAFIAIFLLFAQSNGRLSFSVQDLLTLQVPPQTQVLLFLAFAVAFAIKVPLFPFHTWLPDAHVQAPTAGSVILAGVLLKMGTYGFMRFAIPLFPQAAHQIGPIIAGLAIVGILYGAWVAYAQRDIKSLVAYSSVSHLGFVMLGLFALNPQGWSGGLVVMLSHGFSTGALFLLVGMIYDRRHTRLIADFDGLWKVMPVFAAFFMFVMFASIGLPGLSGFIGEFLVLLGAARAVWVWAVLGTFGVVLAAVYMLPMYGRVFFGPVTKPENLALKGHDLNRREVAVLVPLVILILVMGLAPNLFLRPAQPAIEQTLSRVNAVTTAMR
ncbi:MAG: NADH-quinone oxidoreductase subunit M [Ardenticatenaceae bacterium]|nr:NADH-quinone oxidoreductase subunit M [Ardenticatenaceae bacterium]HBY98553.1 Fe-S-binding domain-containing protein [Chloroflexota bacterium]